MRRVLVLNNALRNRVKRRVPCRHASVAPGEPVVQEHKRQNVTVLRLANPPVNVLDTKTITALRAALSSPANATNALVLAGAEGIFSAGLDIREMYQPEDERFRAYFANVQALFFELFMHSSPVVAAITGASPAGGCWLACCSDYRIISNSPRAVIGLNETHIGVVAPSYVAEPMMRLVGRRVGEQMLQKGTLLPPLDALRVGLVDEVAPADLVVERAVVVAAELLAVPFAARAESKKAMRRELADSIRRGLPEEMARMTEWIRREDIQSTIGRYLESLNKKKKLA